jgi:hypothetical protein
MTHEPSTPTSRPATSARIVRGCRGRDCSARERVERAARCYVNRLPLEVPGLQQAIEAPTLEQLAIAYNVSVARIQRVLNGE